jgi:HPt (histidine-containing phosphotransfer) domain-containing protein
MPELDGLETAKAIRTEARSPRPFVVALTASAMSGDREKCLSAGMDDYVAKPLQREALAAVLERAKKAIENLPAAPLSTPTPRSGSQRRPRVSPPAPSAAAPSAAVAVDIRALERLRALGMPAGAPGSDLVTELVDTFLKDVPDKLSRISKALAEEDYLRAHRFTHSLVSAAGNLGAIGVVKAARTLESLLRLKSRIESQDAYRALQAEFDLAAPELSRHRQKVD